METTGQRAKTVARLLGRALAMALTLAASLAWAGFYGLTRVAAASKRVWFCGLLVGGGSLAALYGLHAAQPATMTILLSLGLTAALGYVSRDAWVEYIEKLTFLARAEVHGRRIHAGPEWSEVWRGHARDRVGRGYLAVAVLVVVLAVYGWWASAAVLRLLVSSVVLSLAGFGFLVQAVLTWRVERAERAAFYHRGWPVGEARRFEEWLSARWPRSAKVLATRALLTEMLAPALHSFEGLLVPRGGCQG